MRKGVIFWFRVGFLGGYSEIHILYITLIFQHEFPESFVFHIKILYINLNFYMLVIKIVLKFNSLHTKTFLKRILFIFRQRGRKGEREGEKHQCVVVSCALPPNGDLACNPSMCPAWESNW